METKYFLTSLFLTSVSLVQAAQPARPNIIVIFADDLGYGDLGCYGNKLNRTPNLDQLAKEGVRFTDCYSAANVCTPSRAALLTGRYPLRSGLANVLHPWHSVGIDSLEVTMPEMLAQAGYHTGMVGKWHLGHKKEYLPLQHGFQEYFGIPYSNDMKPCIYIRGNEVESPEVDQTQLTKTYTKEALRFISENKDRPFFLYLAHNMPHVPLFASDQFKGKSANGLYGDVIEELDWSVGEVMQQLQKLKLDENTLVVFSSDNGPWLTQGPHGGSAYPLFQGKMTTWEGGHRVPAMAFWKGKIQPKVYSGLVTLMDWFPTFAQIAQAKLPDQHIMDGCDLSDIIFKNGKRENEEFYFFQSARILAYRSGDFKLTLPNGVRKGNQFVADVPAHDTLLFNLRTDIGESANLVKTNPDKLNVMADKLDNFRNSLNGLNPKNLEPRPQNWPR